MPRRRSPEGVCRICGTHGKLSFEHVPPREAFNDQRLIEVPFETAIEAGLDGEFRGKPVQGGAGAYTLCPRCNNNTGNWYARDFIHFTYQGGEYLMKSGGQLSLGYPYYIYPLRIIKQIVTMFFSVNSERFSEANPELVRFVLDKERQYLSPRYKVFAAHTRVGRMRRSGISVITRMSESGYSTITLSEIVFWPFVYVLTIDSNAPSDHLTDISWFAKYGYNTWDVLYPAFRRVDTYLPLPGDYRTRQEILRDWEENTKFQAR